MSLISTETKRRVVPRWRDLTTTARLAELESIGTPGAGPLPNSDAFFAEKTHRWHIERDVASAAELVGAALVLGRPQDAQEAAQFLIRPESEATETVRQVAEHVLGQTVPSSGLPARPQAAVRHLRSRLREQPRNPIAWCELSRQFAILGQRDKARTAMRSAISLVESNRYVLRSAARLFVHLDEPDEAHHILKNREATRIDPWLLAAEIAVASVAGRRSQLLKRARSLMADRRLSARHTAELASAVATVQFEDGSTGAARKLFRQSLVDPTDNSVAQATWASRRISGVDVNERALKLSHTFEARTWTHFWRKLWKEALADCRCWLGDEPFSSRPALVGSYLAHVTLQDFTLTEELARQGLNANPKDPGLLNNLVVALADQGRVDEAEDTFHAIDGSSASVGTRITLAATEGLLHFRRGRVVEGRTRYLDAADWARRESHEYARLLALAYLAREELTANTAKASETLKVLLEVQGLEERYPDIALVVERLRQTAQAEKAL